MVSIHNSRMDNLLLDRKTKGKKEIILLLGQQGIHRNGTVLEMNSKSSLCSRNSNSNRLLNPLCSSSSRFHNPPVI